MSENGNIFAKTFLEQAFALPLEELLKSGNLVPSGWYAISPMTDTERRLWHAFVSAPKEIKKTCNACVFAGLREARESGRNCPELPRLAALHEQEETVKALFWRLMQDRVVVGRAHTALAISPDGMIYVPEEPKMLVGAPEINGNPFVGTYLDAAFDTPVDELIGPKDPVAEGENVIGDMTELEQRLFHFLEQKMKESVKLVEEFDSLEKSESPADRDRLDEVNLQGSNLAKNVNVVEKLMRELIKSRFVATGAVAPDFWRTNTIGVREGNKVVSFADKDFLAEFLKEIEARQNKN
ncbi:MAG: hypothetical protein WC310_02710 [Patescibacteria group bacterium]|jgi:hypothetical protein